MVNSTVKGVWLEQYLSHFEGRNEAAVGESSGFYGWDS
jgi:hypothetical protein